MGQSFYQQTQKAFEMMQMRINMMDNQLISLMLWLIWAPFIAAVLLLGGKG